MIVRITVDASVHDFTPQVLWVDHGRSWFGYSYLRIVHSRRSTWHGWN